MVEATFHESMTKATNMATDSAAVRAVQRRGGSSSSASSMLSRAASLSIGTVVKPALFVRMASWPELGWLRGRMRKHNRRALKSKGAERPSLTENTVPNAYLRAVDAAPRERLTKI
jgi:hypothetical protein